MSRVPPAGFVLPAVVILLAIAALLVIDAVRSGAMSQALAGAARLRLSAAEAADGAQAQVESALAAQRDPPPVSERNYEADITTTTRVRLELIETLTPGYSANRVAAQRFRARAVARAPRGTQFAIEAGYTRLVPAP